MTPDPFRVYASREESTESMNEASTAPSAITVRSLLVGWANDQDAWIRHLVSDVVVSAKPMTDAQLDAIFQTFLREKALSTGSAVNVPKLSDDARRG
jgi:hypothetical protein